MEVGRVRNRAVLDYLRDTRRVLDRCRLSVQFGAAFLLAAKYAELKGDHK